MIKTLKAALAVSVLVTPAMAANMENPLYMPTQGEIYSKTAAGLMIKKADSSDAHVAKAHDGEIEFPIWRIQENLGLGITNRLTVRGAFAYTQDDDISRKGMNHGRFGLIYRAIETSDKIVLDVYADAHLGGVNKMRGAYTTQGFQYDNYSNGRWGVDAGIQFGKTWGGFTASAFAEVLKTFGSHNNVIDVAGYKYAGMPVTALGIPGEISIDLKSTTEINMGINAFYQVNDTWSWGAGVKYNHHADNGVKSLVNKVTNPIGKQIAAGLIQQFSNMDDGFDEYIVSVSVANQLTKYTQVALYGEYTFDTAHANSQNGTDLKAEVGVRLNLAF